MRWIVPYPAGGGADVVARHITHAMEKPLGQTFIVENRPGGGTIIGASAIAKAEPNGYVIGTADSGTLAFNPTLYAKLPYRADSFTYIGGLAKFPLMLAVRAYSPFKSLDDIIQTARKTPGTLSASSAGAGSPHYLALELFQQRAKVKVLHVPYKEAAPAIQDLLGGQINLMFVDLAAGLPNIKAGKLRVLGVAMPERLQALPDVPTMAELGIANFTAYAWQGLVGPAGLPDAVVKKLSAELQTTLAQPAVTQQLTEMGVIPIPMSSADFQAYAAQERAARESVIKTAGIKLE